MRPEARTRLGHVVDAGEAILRFVNGKSFDDYEHDEMLHSAVERKFGIVGEALREAVRAEPALARNVAQFRSIVDFRNILVHDYATVYNEAVWRIIKEHLPLLLSQVRLLLGQNPA
jgi:uncharacterized protein with HEPN domain